MTVGAVIIAYLAIGAVFSLLFVRAVKVATDPGGRWSKRPDTEATVRAAERAVGGFPGGMPAVLITFAVFWPMVLVYLVANWRKR
jgi:hypothetical protein